MKKRDLEKVNIQILADSERGSDSYRIKRCPWYEFSYCVSVLYKVFKEVFFSFAPVYRCQILWSKITRNVYFKKKKKKIVYNKKQETVSKNLGANNTVMLLLKYYEPQYWCFAIYNFSVLLILWYTVT